MEGGICLSDTLKLTGTLADETRYSIYQYIVKENTEVNVQQIAQQFGIHPNVARLHLTKLNEAKLLTSKFVKNEKGGRPARVYLLAEDPIHLSFPKQENHLLLEWLMELVDTMGEEAIEKAKEIAYQNGQKVVNHHPLMDSMTFEEKLDMLKETAHSIGYVPTVMEKNNKKIITFSIFNCPYKDFLSKYPQFICLLHESFLKGQFDKLFPANSFIQLESKQNHCINCVYHVEVL